MRAFYDELSKKIDKIDFSVIYPGFYGNTTIEFEGEHIAIRRIDAPLESYDMDILAAGIVHEMFHAFQMDTDMHSEAPNDLKILQYPDDEANCMIKQHENTLLTKTVNASPKEKVQLYHLIRASRKIRRAAVGDIVDQEELIERWEGQADCSGMLMRLLERETDESRSSISIRMENNNEEKALKVKKFFAEDRKFVEAKGYIRGYDPMNQIRVGDRLLVFEFVAVNSDGEIASLRGPVVVEMEKGSPNMTKGYWI